MSKGQKKPSLRDLSNLLVLDDHIQDIISELEDQTDRGVALIASALVDVSLERLIRCRLVHYKDVDEAIFTNEGAPLNSFASRIKMARALGVIGEWTEGHLHSIRRIRNQFAHSPLKIDFANPLIAGEIDKLLPDNPEWKPKLTTQRRRFYGTCVTIIQAFDAREKEHIHDRLDIWTV